MSGPLHTHGTVGVFFSAPVLGKVTYSLPGEEQRGTSLLVADQLPPVDTLKGLAGVLTSLPLRKETLLEIDGLGVPVIHRATRLGHLAANDVISLNPSGYVRTLYRPASDHNVIFATDRCNSFCLMCSQPPKPADDTDRLAEHLRLIELMDPAPRTLGITGGEPTLLKDDFLRLISYCRDLLPSTALHVLSNGRLFYYGSYARKLAEISHPDMVLAIPLYSDIDSEHDYIVQCRGAFEETMIGLQNLGRYGVPVEIRVVLHRPSLRRLPQLAQFIYRNLPFACHVALMGLEMMGFAVPNTDQLWIDPCDYKNKLQDATLFLASRGMNVSIYNHQLCVVPPELWPFCRKSISDWKNSYLEVCTGCSMQENCGGFFSSSLLRNRVSRGITPI